MTKKPQFWILAIILLLGFYAVLQKPAVPQPSSQQGDTEQTPLPSSSPQSQVSCIDPTQLATITQVPLELTFEQQRPALHAVQCRYVSTQLVRDLPVSVQYVFRLEYAEKDWLNDKQLISTSSGFHSITEYPDVLARVNPVAEIKQGTFYTYAQGKYIELSYTPVDLSTGDLLKRGGGMVDLIVKKY